MFFLLGKTIFHNALTPLHLTFPRYRCATDIPCLSPVRVEGVLCRNREVGGGNTWDSYT